jgi:hypothetical protein
MAEDQLEEIFQDFLAAQKAKDTAIEILDEANSVLKSANKIYDRAVEALSEYLGRTEESISGGDTGLFGTLKTVQNFTNPKNLGELFGDLF